MTHSIPSYMFSYEVAKSVHRLCGFPSMALSMKLASKYWEEVGQMWAEGVGADACAKAIHRLFVNAKHEYKQPSVVDHLESGVCLGVHKIR